MLTSQVVFVIPHSVGKLYWGSVQIMLQLCFAKNQLEVALWNKTLSRSLKGILEAAPSEHCRLHGHMLTIRNQGYPKLRTRVHGWRVSAMAEIWQFSHGYNPHFMQVSYICGIIRYQIYCQDYNKEINQTHISLLFVPFLNWGLYKLETFQHQTVLIHCLYFCFVQMFPWPYIRCQCSPCTISMFTWWHHANY